MSGVRKLIPLAALALLTVVFYWKLALTDQYIWFDHPDMAYLEIPRMQFQAREIHGGRFPLWDPHIWAGQPLIGQTQPGPLFPLNLLFYLVPLKDGYIRFAALNWYWVVIHFLAALMFYWLARDLGLSILAAIASAAAFGFGGFIGTVAWLDVVNGFIWAPAVFLFLMRSLRGERPYGNAALAGLFLGIAWLSGHHEMPLLLSATAAGTCVWGCRRNRTFVLPAALFLTCAFLIGAVQILPTYEFGSLSRRWVGLGDTVGWKDKIPYKVHTLYSLPAEAFLGTVLPSYGRFGDSSPYVGWVVTAFAFLGVVARWGDRAVRWALSVSAIFAVYSLGVYAPLNGIIYALVPVLEKARIPSRGMAVFDFGLCVLAAYGIDAALRDSREPWARRVARFLAITGAVILAATAVFTLSGKPVNERIPLGALACLAASGLLAAHRAGSVSRAVVGGGLLATVLVELTSGGPALYPNRLDSNAWGFARKLEIYRDIAEYLRKEDKPEAPIRVVVNDGELGISFGDWHGLDILHGYVAGATNNMLIQELHTPRTQDLFGIHYWISSKPDRPGVQRDVFTGSSGIKVFRNPSPFPRAWVVHETRELPDDSWLRINIQDPAMDLRRTALFIGKGPSLERCGGDDKVQIASRRTDSVVVNVESACAGLLVLGETNYPGWTVTIDGAQARMWQPYGVFRGVVTPAGKHRVVFRFRPRSVYVGAGLMLFGLIVVAAVWRGRR